MKRGGKKFVGGFLAVLLVFAVALVAIAQQAPPDTVTIKEALFASPTKPAVQFPHKQHFETLKIDCTTCHHAWQGGKNVWKKGDPVKKCDSCHTNATVENEKSLPPDQLKLNLKNAFHEKCVTCHKDEKKKNPSSKAPIMCNGCHK
jgi:hypothetical protein